METKNNNMNMKPAPKKDDSNGLLGGALGAAIGTALGATFGVGGAYAYNRLADNDDDIAEVNIPLDQPADDEVAIAEHPHHHHHDVHHVHETSDVYVVTPPRPVPDPDPNPPIRRLHHLRGS